MNKSAIVTALALTVSASPLIAQDPGAQPAPSQRPSSQAAAPGEPLSYHLFPPRAQEKLNLNSEQQKQVAALAVDVSSKLGVILTAEQQQQLGRMHRPGRGPGSGGPAGTGGLGGTGGPNGTGGLGGTGGKGGTGTGPDGQTTGKGSDWGAVTPGHPDAVPGVPATKITGFHLIAPRTQELLALSADQQKQVQELETEVKGKLATILTPDQELQLEQLRNSPRSSDSDGAGTDAGSKGPAASVPSTGSAPERP